MSCSTPLTSGPTAQPQTGTGEKKALSLTPNAIVNRMAPIIRTMKRGKVAIIPPLLQRKSD